MKEENRIYFLNEQKKILEKLLKMKDSIENQHGGSFSDYSKDRDWRSLMQDITAVRDKIIELE